MSVIQAFPFNDEDDYSLSGAALDEDHLILALNDDGGLAFAQNFSADTDFIYDDTAAEFVAGVLRQIDNRPAGITLFDAFTSGSVANWGDGTLTRTLTNATVTGGQLVCQGTSTAKYADYLGASNANSPQVGTIRFDYIPNFTGAPSVDLVFFEWGNGSSSASVMQMYLATSGNVVLAAFNSAGALQHSSILGAFNAVSGVKKEIEINYDYTTGATRVFRDGVQYGSTITNTFTRLAGDLTKFRLGGMWTNSFKQDAIFDNLVIFSSVQHTAGYSAPSTVPPLVAFSGSLVELPDFAYTGVGAIAALTNLTSTETGSPRWIFFGKYWNGSAWVASDDSYSQANSLSTALTNIASLDPDGETTLAVKIRFDDSATQSSVSQLDITYTGQQYGPEGYAEPVLPVDAKTLIDYTEDVGGNGSVLLILKIDGALKWFDGSEWVDSDGSSDEANTAEELVAAFEDLHLGSSSSVLLRWVLVTDDPTQTPTLNFAMIEYQYGANETEPAKCTVFGFVKDISGQPVEGATVRFDLVKSNKKEYNEANANVILNPTVTVLTDSQGLFTVDLIRSSEFEGDGGTYRVQITKDTLSAKQIAGQRLTFQVPDAATKDITDLFEAVA